MDRYEEIRDLRDQYESALDEADARRSEYHRAIRKLHASGVPLREIAENLGVSHQRIHQIVGGEQPPSKRGRRTGTVIAGLLLMGAVAAGALSWGLFGPGHQAPTAPSSSGLEQSNVCAQVFPDAL